MAIRWFYQTVGCQQSGPVDSKELRRLAQAGIVRPDTLVRQGTSDRWIHAEQVRGLFQRSMPDAFDPYYKWLGIAPEDQPPNHYKLLGIPPFESDAEVISRAADMRIAYVRNLQAGKHAELALQIRNEISQARICLLDAEQKADYDRQLRDRSAPEPAAVQTPQRTPEPAVTAEVVPEPDIVDVVPVEDKAEIEMSAPR